MRACFAVFLICLVNHLDMKNIIVCVMAVVTVICVALNLPTEKQVDYDYLRIHIRANSNSTIDQNVKIKVKDNVVAYLTPKLCNVQTKQQAVDIVVKERENITLIVANTLKANGLEYGANVKLTNEYFPTRTYVNTTLESGYYDAVVVELGDAVGDNWWCVMYPPLCFATQNNTNKVKFKSRFVQWFENLFKG